jgi:zinc protease
MAGAILDVVERGLQLSWIDEYPTKIAALTLDDVNAAIRRHVDPKKMITVTAGTLGEKPE